MENNKEQRIGEYDGYKYKSAAEMTEEEIKEAEEKALEAKKWLHDNMGITLDEDERITA